MNAKAQSRLRQWYKNRGWKAFPFQKEMAQAYLAGNNGLLNAPTGSGKTYAMWLPVLLEALAEREAGIKTKGLQVIWITPLRALAKDVVKAMSSAVEEMGLDWKVETRTGDTKASQKTRQKKRMPEALVTTPESLHVLFSNKKHARWFQSVKLVVVDEWHELIGTKRGVQLELGIAHLRTFRPKLRIWGISATIGNMTQSLEVLLGSAYQEQPHVMVRADIEKRIQMDSILPETLERFPWTGHMGINMLDLVLPVLENAGSTLIFTNTRAQCEIWYQALLAAQPDLAGIMAMHHGSISSELRSWVEDALHTGQLKVVVCTSSLDLGVDFRPVDTIIQIGGPKGVARFLQRAGRSGHHPGALSQIYFVPTHSLELIEASALREAIASQMVEDRIPVVLAYDVLLQYLLTLGVADGFDPASIFQEVRETYAYRQLSEADFSWMLEFLTTGGKSLFAYDHYHKIEIEEDGTYLVNDKRIARQHRMSIGTIVSDVVMTVKYLKGGKIGTVEESFISQLKPGDVFWFSGRSLELVRIRDLEVQVKRSKAKKGKVPRWMGSRMPLSSQMSDLLRKQMADYRQGNYHSVEMKKLVPLFQLQQRLSEVPGEQDCLIETVKSREGHHLFIYPFEGRVVHEVLGALFAWRIAQLQPISFTVNMNDYGLELLSDQEIPFERALEAGLFSTTNLAEDVHRSINETEMARRQFREIASIAGLVFQGYPGKRMKNKHLQASTALLFQVFQEYEPENLLLKQAFDETLTYQIDENRLARALERLQQQNLLLTAPPRLTPFGFPIMVDRMRARLNVSSERLVDRVRKMQLQLERGM